MCGRASFISWLRTVGLFVLVQWEKLKRQWTTWRYHTYRTLYSDLIRRNEQHYDELAGPSAPDLTSDPVHLSRSLAHRVVDAWCVYPSFKFQCTHLVKLALSNPSLNMLPIPRDDVCFIPGILNHIDSAVWSEKDDSVQENPEELIVRFKQGMKTYSVAYRQDLIFPPSVPQRDASDQPLIKLVHRATIDGVDETSALAEWAGPAGDFYLNSQYESQAADVKQACGVSSQDCKLFIELEDVKFTLEDHVSLGASILLGLSIQN